MERCRFQTLLSSIFAKGLDARVDSLEKYFTQSANTQHYWLGQIGGELNSAASAYPLPIYLFQKMNGKRRCYISFSGKHCDGQDLVDWRGYAHLEAD